MYGLLRGAANPTLCLLRLHSGTGEEINTNYFLFQCSIALTDKGLANAADVAAQVMAYIAMLTAEGTLPLSTSTLFFFFSPF